MHDGVKVRCLTAWLIPIMYSTGRLMGLAPTNAIATIQYVNPFVTTTMAIKLVEDDGFEPPNP